MRRRPDRASALLALLLGSCLWTAWNLCDVHTVNYGIARPAFWVDLVAWHATYLCAAAAAKTLLVAAGRRARATAPNGLPWQLPLLLAGLTALLWLLAHAARVQQFLCWGHGTDHGFLSQLQGSIFPLQLAHYTFTRDVYLRRRSNRSFDRWSEKGADDFQREQSFKNVCTNTAMRAVHRELQAVAPTHAVSDDGIQLLAAMYTAVDREGPNIDLWIDHHLRLGFDFVHLVLDASDNAIDTNTPLFAQWGHRIRVTQAAPNCSQGCAKKTLIGDYAATAGWLAWLDADEFVFPTRWNGKATLRRTLARLRSLGYCQIGMPWIAFGDSRLSSRPPSPLEAFVHTSALQWPPYGKAVAWLPALDPTDGFQHAARIRDTVPFCKILDRGVLTTVLAGNAPR